MSALDTTMIPVEGMHCGGCANTLGKVLGGIEGVATAEADADEGQVQVQFEPALVTEDQLREGVRTAGFHPA